jgi:iron complex transport system ATP-binding protein
VRVSGRDAASLSRRELARQVAIVLQDPPTDVPFTVAELVLMGRAPHLGRLGLDGPRDRGIAEAAMRHTGVLDLAGRPIDQLSGGEKRRALLARALAQEPKVLLLDEPTAFLDLGHQANLMEHCRALLARGMCIVCVLHDPNLAVAWADEVALMDRGEIVAQGAAKAVLSGERLEALYGASLVKTVGPSGEGPFFSPRRRA